jgi:hypothetical protein
MNNSLSDTDFLQAFERGDYYLLEGFPHDAHVRLAWLYLRNDRWDVGTRKIREAIQRLALAHGASRKYHETITLFWAHIVNVHISMSPELDSFSAFTECYPQLLDTGLIKLHYSADLLRSEAARQTWNEPDLRPLLIPR